METTNFTVTDDLLASKGQRFANYIIDFIVQLILFYGIMIIVGIIAAFTGDAEALLERIDGLNGLEQYLLGAIEALLYYLPMEIFLARTVGKFITKTVVVMEDGSKPDAATIFKRTCCRLIPLEALSFFGYRGWHDSIPDVYVVKKQEFEEARDLFNSFEEIGRSEEI